MALGLFGLRDAWSCLGFLVFLRFIRVFWVFRVYWGFFGFSGFMGFVRALSGFRAQGLEVLRVQGFKFRV